MCILFTHWLSFSYSVTELQLYFLELHFDWRTYRVGVSLPEASDACRLITVHSWYLLFDLVESSVSFTPIIERIGSGSFKLT